MQRNHTIAALAVAAVVGGGIVAGTALADGDGEDTSRALRTAAGTPAGDRTDGTGNAPPPAGSGSVTAEQAVQRALAAAQGTGTELDAEEDGRVWEVTVLGADGTWREVDVARADGRVLGVDRDDDGDDRDDDRHDAARVREALRGTQVTLADAARIGAEQGRGTVDDVELDGTWWTVGLGGGEDDDDREVRVSLTGDTAPAADDDADDRDDDGKDDDSRDDDRDDDGDDDRDDRGDDGDDDHGDD
ncbi:PepSY domain-containing protein [Streptomyces sp. TRM 70351]|uniref:PepSY domain-containing protein n=1 Tax=Streptomyces sp. TRM 70351 TaxID=3116552 RepID=UPI002E7C02CF|nr:PepSY domain-containing protein [Streptomyces sp. TRM 70351]MEE1927469.1 PepSY domain-containing protein [Streptomyces sp. TRM 70351]